MSSRRALGALLRLYPSDFRAAFGDEMLEVFAQRHEDIRRERGVAGVLALWWRTLPGVLGAALLERVESRRPFHRPPRERRNSMERMLQDLRYGLRTLARSPGFSAVAVLTLALGIGVNTVVFSLVNAFLLRPLPRVEDPSRLVVLFTGQYGSVGVSSYMEYLDFTERNRTLDGFAAYKPRRVDLTDDDGTTRIDGMLVTGNYFDVLGVRPELGRFFAASDDDEPGAETVAVLSHDLWQSRLGGDPDVLGRSVRLNGLSFTVVGVAPATFRGVYLESRPQVFVPMMMQAHLMPASGYLLDRRGWGGILTVGRLRDGVSFEQAREDFAGTAAWLRETYPDYAGEEYRLVPLPQATLMPSDRAQVVRFSGLLTVMMAVVLMVACVNVANLMLSRALRRRRELAVRQALGAGRGRLVRQLLVESLILSAIGGAAGVAMAYAVSGMLEQLPLPFVADFGFDIRMLAFALGAALLTGVGFGTAPALAATRIDLAWQMHGDRGKPAGRRFSLSGGLVIAQVALSLVLLVAAGLFARTLVRLGSSDLGFEPDNVLVATVDPSLQGYGGEQLGEFYRRLLERVGAIPGVASVSIASALPAAGGDSLSIDIEGVEMPEAGLLVDVNVVGPDYFETMGIAVRRGRGFTQEDARLGERLVVVNEAGAELLGRLVPGDLLDARISFDGSEGPYVRIVGVAADSKTSSLRENPPPLAYIGPYAWSEMTVLARTDTPPAGLAAALRTVLREVDPNVPAFDVGTLREHLSGALLPERLATGLLGFAAGLALVLASVGLYGVLSYSVARRTREMGIRMALGARVDNVRFLVVRQALLLALFGMALGLVGALGASSLLTGFLYGVAPTDPATYIAVIAILLVVALAASYVPARRATRVDPREALRAD